MSRTLAFPLIRHGLAGEESSLLNQSMASKIKDANRALLVEGNRDAVDEFFTADYVAHGTDQKIQGHGAIWKFVRELQQGFPDLEVEVEILVKRKTSWRGNGGFRGLTAAVSEAFPRPAGGWSGATWWSADFATGASLRTGPEWFLVALLDGQIVACVMAGYEGHRGWLNYLAVDPEHQRHGLARAIVAEAERLLREAGCPKINLQIRTSNHGVIEFYRRLGYSTDDVVSMGKRLEHDDKGV